VSFFGTPPPPGRFWVFYFASSFFGEVIFRLLLILRSELKIIYKEEEKNVDVTTYSLYSLLECQRCFFFTSRSESSSIRIPHATIL
jgi:hypothetical protein